MNSIKKIFTGGYWLMAPMHVEKRRWWAVIEINTYSEFKEYASKNSKEREKNEEKKRNKKDTRASCESHVDQFSRNLSDLTIPESCMLKLAMFLKPDDQGQEFCCLTNQEGVVKRTEGIH